MLKLDLSVIHQFASDRLPNKFPVNIVPSMEQCIIANREYLSSWKCFTCPLGEGHKFNRLSFVVDANFMVRTFLLLLFLL